MSRVLRLVVTVLLALALPMQVVAATTMTLCGSRPAAVESHADPSAPSHDAHHAAHASRDKQPDSKSAACEACCSAAAMPPPALSLAGAEPTDGFARAVSIGSLAFLTAGPERPPRPFLA